MNIICTFHIFMYGYVTRFQLAEFPQMDETEFFASQHLFKEFFRAFSFISRCVAMVTEGVISCWLCEEFVTGN